MKPLGFYVSVVKEHPDYEQLALLEEKYGSYFESVGMQDLWAMLYFCSVCIPKGLSLAEKQLVCKLSNTTLFNLIPFLHQVIAERMSQNTEEKVNATN
jgi:hypothetical protein